MSEYQYCEFLAIDRPLTAKERDELRRMSTRAEITATSFTNTYEWGNFKGDPDAMMDRYFDAFVYVANWGTNRLVLRVPRGSIDLDAAAEYADDEVLSIRATKDHVILQFLSDPEEPDDEWIDGEDWMPSLVGLRNDLMRGDFRAIYIAWLASLGPSGWLDEDLEKEADDILEPPVPPGLGKLTGPLRSLADFLRVNEDLLEAAEAGNSGQAPAEPSRAELARWVEGLPTADKDAYLLRLVAEDTDLAISAELATKFRKETAPSKRGQPSSKGRRTISQLVSTYKALAEGRTRAAAKRAAEEQARREREQAGRRKKYLDDLARREPQAWAEVDALIAAKKAKEYDRAVELLVDLCALAE